MSPRIACLISTPPTLHICPLLGYDTTSTTTFAKTKFQWSTRCILWDPYGGSVRTCHGLKRWNIKGIGPPITKIKLTSDHAPLFWN